MNDLIDLLDIPTWAKRAACRHLDPELFFPAPGDCHCVADAKAVCRRCPVQRECLAYALRRHERHGIWGGTTERERRRILRLRRVA